MSDTIRTPKAPVKPWNLVKDFIDEETKYCVRVTVQEHFRPRYSIAVGRWISPPDGNREEYLGPHIPIMIDSENGRITIRPLLGMVSSLIENALEHIHNLAQLREDEIIEQKQEKELRDVNRNKPQTRVTGKTQRVKEKRHESS